MTDTTESIPFEQLQPQELLAIQAPADAPDERPIPEQLAAEFTRLLHAQRIPVRDGHLYFGDVAVGKGGKTATVNGVLLPAGAGDEVQFTLAISS